MTAVFGEREGQRVVCVCVRAPGTLYDDDDVCVCAKSHFPGVVVDVVCVSVALQSLRFEVAQLTRRVTSTVGVVVQA